MKRIQEKVKDIVEVRAYESLRDFISNPAQTVAIYHFTDMTADLMAKWLDSITNVQVQNGAACALAGYRGVGKSHFLATLGALLAQPELRSRITETHVLAGAQRLKRRRYNVAFVRRGLRASLLDELKDALAEVFEIDTAELSDELPELLDYAAKKSGDLPFVLMIDTAFERASRVLREDGMLLGEIAEIAKNLNIFVGVALDDDIAGADGVNAAIARSFKIDYLDQEHLYRIVDTNIFPKQSQMTSILHEIYTYFREVLPNFRWSEQRFAALYPLHPVILEVAPFIRLYVPDFALLGFASEAGKKILGRPANSLIALDEVFDNVESTLRKVDDLKDTFAAYDKLSAEVISHIPIMQRLQAKLVLKALLLLSLDGDGATAGEIAAAMLVFDENEPARAIQVVEQLTESFAAALPEDVQQTTLDNGEVRFGLKVSSKDNLNSTLTEASQGVSAEEVIPKILRRISRDKFSDWTISDEGEAAAAEWMECQIKWRGGLRRGRVFWDLENETGTFEQTTVLPELIDWEMVISQQDVPKLQTDQDEIPRVYWQAAPLKKDEIDTVLRYHVLLTKTDLHEEFGEYVRAAGHAHTLAVEKIWNRVFLQEGKLIIDNSDYALTDEARAAQNLSEMLSIMLEPLFETRYPMHPFFAQTLGMNEVSALVNDLFSGARQNLEPVQRLAETFALPLGLVALRGDSYVLETEEKLLSLPLMQEILSLVDDNADEMVSLKTVYHQLKKVPNGLVREAQHLILTALVAQRRIEFVTSKGDRINRRSLDLKIIWDDIEGIAKPIGAVYSAKRLTVWAKTLTGADAFQTIETPADRQAVRLALENWLTDWKAARVLERFADLPDELLNTKIWRLAVHAEKTFGAVAQTAGAVLDDSISLDEGLHRIADAFSDSEEEFSTSTKDLVVMEDFISGSAKREQIWTYLAVCETTEDEKIELLREQLLQIIGDGYANPNESLNREMENLWENFHARFSDHFAIKHDLVMKSHHLHEQFDEIMRGDEWWEFENLSKVSIFQQVYWKEAQAVTRQFKQLDCRYDVREMLKTHPFCACPFNLAQSRDWEKLPQTLREIISRGRQSYRRSLLLLKETLIPPIEQFSAQMKTEEFTRAAAALTAALLKEKEIPLFDNFQLIIVQKILEFLPASPLLQLKMPTTQNFVNREDLRQIVNEWLDELPNEPALFKV